MGLFGSIPREDTEVKRMEYIYSGKFKKLYEQYIKSINQYNNLLQRYEDLMKKYEYKYHAQDANHATITMDLTYIKEQGHLLADQYKELKEAIEEEKNHRTYIQKQLVTHGRLLKVSTAVQSIMLITMIVMLLYIMGILII